MGNYDELEGGLFENSALYLSGGLHQEYKTSKAADLSKKQTNDADTEPSCEELFEIIKISLKRKDMAGCILEDVKFTTKFCL